MVNPNLGIWINKDKYTYSNKVPSIAHTPKYYYYLKTKSPKYSRSAPIEIQGEQAFVKVAPLELAEWS